jgi:hypothetical protein
MSETPETSKPVLMTGAWLPTIGASWLRQRPSFRRREALLYRVELSPGLHPRLARAQREAKYVTAVSGAAVLGAVRIDHWEQPWRDLTVDRFVLSGHLAEMRKLQQNRRFNLHYCSEQL